MCRSLTSSASKAPAAARGTLAAGAGIGGRAMRTCPGAGVYKVGSSAHSSTAAVAAQIRATAIHCLTGRLLPVCGRCSRSAAR